MESGKAIVRPSRIAFTNTAEAIAEVCDQRILIEQRVLGIKKSRTGSGSHAANRAAA